jgi:hypothetical protein
VPVRWRHSPERRIGLAYLLQHGVRWFDEIYVESEANPPIMHDGKRGAFFRAIIMRDDEAMLY